MEKIISIVILTLLLPTLGLSQGEHKLSAQEHLGHKENQKARGVQALSHDLRHLLVQEMQALQTGMMSIIPAYVSGNWLEIESTAKQMNESYILKQNLTDKQMHELHSVLPEGFITKDQRFHYLAGMLEHAAKSKKPELINFYFSEMNKSCLGCHSQFATHKFPALLASENKQQHSH